MPSAVPITAAVDKATEGGRVGCIYMLFLLPCGWLSALKSRAVSWLCLKFMPEGGINGEARWQVVLVLFC